MMKKRILAAVMAAAVFFSTAGAGVNIHAAEDTSDGSGTTYYVSSLHGKDSNNGTSEDTPFYSLQKINDLTLKPGDKILLESGSVFKNGYLHLYGQSGDADRPILIDKYGNGANPVIDTNGQGIWFQNYGYRLDNTWHKYQGYVSSSILLYDSEYIEISNLEIVNQNPEIDTVYNAEDMMDRTGVAAVAQDKGTIDHIHLKNLNIHDVIGNVYNKHMNNGGIYFTVYMPHDAVLQVKPGQNDVTNAALKRRDFISSQTGVPRYDDVLIEGCSVTNTNRWGIAVGYTALWDKFADTSEIADSIIREYGSTNVIIRNNYVKDAGGDSITLMYCDRPLVEYNISDGSGRQMHSGDYNGETQRFSAAIWPWKCKDAVFQYNEAFDTKNTNGENGDGQAWDADWGDGTVYQYNYSHNNGGGCLMVCLDEAYRTTFRYNISQNDLMGVLCLFTSHDTHIYNNVFYVKEGVPINRTDKSGGPALIENNVFYYSGEEAGTNADWMQGSGKVYSNNLYYNYADTPENDAAKVVVEKGTRVFENPGTAPVSTTGGINLHENPDVRSVFDGYKLAAASPAIGTGKAVTDKFGKEIEKDFFGNSMKGVTAVDIGAHQHQENAAAAVPPAPSKPEIGQTTENSAVISWPVVWDTVGIKGYKITDQDGKLFLDLTEEALASATDSDTQMISVQLSDLESGKTYTLSITAYDKNDSESEAQTFIITTLEKEDSVITDVKNELTVIEDLNKDDYSEESWSEMETIYNQAADLIASKNPDKSKLDALLAQLKSLKDNLKTPIQQTAANELAGKVAEAEAKINAGQGTYSQKTWEAFVAAYNAAKKPPAGASADELRALAKALSDAQQKLTAVSKEDTLNKDDTYTDTKNKIVYRVVDPSALTAAVKAGQNKKAKAVKIPDTVTIKGKTCKVVQIDSNAFKNYSKMTKLTIGKNVTTIGKNAFMGAKKLKNVVISGNTLKTIQKGAFKNAKKNVKVKWPKGMKKNDLKKLKKNLKKQGLKYK